MLSVVAGSVINNFGTNNINESATETVSFLTSNFFSDSKNICISAIVKEMSSRASRNRTKVHFASGPDLAS